MNPKVGIKTVPVTLRMPYPKWFERVIGWRTKYQNLLTEKEMLTVASAWILTDCKDMGGTAGQHQRSNAGGHLIDLSPFMSEAEAEETFAHEFAHLCDMMIHGNHGHGRTWKYYMVRFGLPPLKCHTIPLTQRSVALSALLKIDQYKKARQ